MSASSPTRSATHRGVGLWKIVTWVGILLAGALYAVVPLELLSSPVAVPIRFVADELDPFAPVVIEISMTSVAAAENEGSQLFGMDTEPVAAGALLDKWYRVQADIAKDLDVIAQCQAGEPCPAPAQKVSA